MRAVDRCLVRAPRLRRDAHDRRYRVPAAPDADAGVDLLFHEVYDYACDQLTSVIYGDGYGGTIRYYDTNSGKLVGAASYSDIGNQRCSDGFSAGTKPSRDCKECALVGSMSLIEPCQGERAQPLIEACMRDLAPQYQDCAQCACQRCFPVALSCRGSATGGDGGMHDSLSALCDQKLASCLHQGCNCEIPDRTP